MNSFFLQFLDSCNNLLFSTNLISNENHKIKNVIEFYISIYSEIFCYGELLDTVQMSKIFPDSKTFVDMKLKQSPEKTLEYFKKWKVDYPNRTKEEVENFVNVSLKVFKRIHLLITFCLSMRA